MNDPRQTAETFFAAIESAWNTADGERYGAEFANVTDFVNVRGEYHHGDGDHIGAAHQGIFDTIYKGSSVRYEVDEARQLAPGVVVAHATSTLDAADRPATRDPQLEDDGRACRGRRRLEGHRIPQHPGALTS